MANETKRYAVPFAESGTTEDVPDQSVGGNVSFETGYGSDYELAQGNPNRKRIPRGAHNELLKGITENLKQNQEQNYPTWIEDALNNGTVNPFPYDQGIVVSHNGNNWVSLEDSNTEEPSASAKHWAPFSGVNFQVDPLTTINGFFRIGMAKEPGVPLPNGANIAPNAPFALKWRAGAQGCDGVVITDSGISWNITNPDHSIVTEKELSAGTEITSADQLTAYVIGDDGAKHYIKDGENSVSISVAGGVATFEFKSGIFAALGITTIKQAFGQFQVGVVGELSNGEVRVKLSDITGLLSLDSSNDLNDISLNSGLAFDIYSSSNIPANAPENKSGSAICYGNNQIYTTVGGNVYMRAFSSGSWRPWSKQTTAEANGNNRIKFEIANGVTVMICIATATITGFQTITWPESFSSIWSANATFSGTSSGGVKVCSHASPTNSGIQARVFDSTTGFNETGLVRAWAIGLV